jgi:putative flippase GtrA
VSWQFIRCSGVGAINTLIGLLLIFDTKAFLYDKDVIANAAGYGTGLSGSFVLNKSWTFQDHGGILASGLRFLSAFVGIVNLTRVWQTGQHEKANAQLPTSPFSL